MSDPKPPRKGQFQPGNKMGKGRPKGCENKFGPDLRQKLLDGIAASGKKKAEKAGINSKVDGTAYFIEALMENTAAASALLSKLIPKETPPERPIGPPPIINVVSVLQGNMWAPGKTLLLPYEECNEAWQAFNGGPETWQEYLVRIEGTLTLKSFEKLCAVPPPEHAKFSQLDEKPLLRLAPDQLRIKHEPVIEPQSLEEERLLAELEGLSLEELTERAAQAGISLVDQK